MLYKPERRRKREEFHLLVRMKCKYINISSQEVVWSFKNRLVSSKVLFSSQSICTFLMFYQRRPLGGLSQTRLLTRLAFLTLRSVNTDGTASVGDSRWRRSALLEPRFANILFPVSSFCPSPTSNAVGFGGAGWSNSLLLQTEGVGMSVDRFARLAEA